MCLRAGGPGESAVSAAADPLCLAGGAHHRRGGQLGHDAAVHARHRSQLCPGELHRGLSVR